MVASAKRYVQSLAGLYASAVASTAAANPSSCSARARSWLLAHSGRVPRSGGPTSPRRKIDLMRAWAYCRYGPVSPSNASMRSQSKT